MLRNIFTPPLRLLTETMLLVLMLWPAPVPIGHRHGDNELRAADQQMVQHLQSHHGGVANARNWPEDWHWHWVYPADGYIGLGGEEIVATTEPMLPSQPFNLPEMPRGCWIDSLTPDRASSFARIPEHRRYSFQSVALLHSRQSLPELLGIMQV